MHRPIRPEDDVVTAFRDGVVTLRKNRRLDGFTNSILEIGYQGIRKGDLVIHGMDAFAGAIGVSDSDGKSTPVYSVCIPKQDEHPTYFCRLLRYMSGSGYIQSLARGIRERSSEFRFEQFSNLEYPLPPRPEQDAIVAFLEAKEQDMAAFIANKRRTIELLKEQKTAIINQAVTRGLNPNVPMKPSGIPWLGEIPKHWEVKRLKFLLRSRLAYGVSEPAEGDNPDFPRYLRITDFDDEGHLRSDTFRSLPPEIAKDYLLHEGDVLFARSGGTVGKAFHFRDYKGEACFAGYLIRAQNDPKQMLSEFLFCFTQTGAFSDWKNSSCIIATIQNISAEKYASLSVPVPPVDEQEAVLKFIEVESQKIASAIATAEREIELMEEYRTALIASAVTGKIDVRNN